MEYLLIGFLSAMGWSLWQKIDPTPPPEPQVMQCIIVQEEEKKEDANL